MPILAELRVISVGTSSTSLSTHIAEALKVLDEMKIRYTLTPFGTCVEVADFRDLASILDRVSKRLNELGVKRVFFDVSVDVRYDKEMSLESMVKSVEEKMKRGS